VDTELEYQGNRLVLVDTAGIRRRGKIEYGIELYSVVRAMRAIDRSDVAVLVIDAAEPTAAQDAHVAGFVREQSKGLMVAVNKHKIKRRQIFYNTRKCIVKIASDHVNMSAGTFLQCLVCNAGCLRATF